MPATFITHLFGGGWAEDFGPSAHVQLAGEALVVMPFLTKAEDCTYQADGGPRKTAGTAKVNSSALESGATVAGFFDAHFQGTAGSPAQHRIVHVGTKIKKDDADGSFSDLFTGLEAGKIPDYAMLEDVLVMCSTSNTDVPKSWDGSTAQSLAGSPPNFAMVERHQNKLWAAGVAAAPSTLYYSVSLDPEDWAGSGSGSIDIDPDDGDQITAIRSFKNRLIVFKGPNKGSIHIITGSAPTGTDAFARQPFIKGIGAAWQHCVFEYGDDLGFVAFDGTVRSLSATDQYGDFREASLSHGLNDWLARTINFAKLNQCWAVNDRERNTVMITLPVLGSSSNNIVIGFNYAFSPVRWSQPYAAQSFACLAEGIDPDSSNRRQVFSGGYDGFVRRHGKSERTIDGDTALAFKVASPFMDYNLPNIMKTMTGGALGIQPKNDGNLTFGWTRDDNAQQTATVPQGGTDVLGDADANEFTLGTSALGGAQFVNRFFQSEEGGEFRQIQFEVTNSVNNEDVELHNVGLRYDPGAESMEN